jgi:VanZ family protein
MRNSLPLLLPGIIATMVLAVALAAPLARFLRTKRAVAALLVLSVGLILAATLSPNLRGLEAVGGQCDLSRLVPPSLETLRFDGDAGRNIVLFVPLGLALGMLPWARRSAAVIGAAFLLTLFVELTQLLVPQLERGCESADVIDNTIGLVLGLAVGTTLRLAFGRTSDQG